MVGVTGGDHNAALSGLGMVRQYGVTEGKGLGVHHLEVNASQQVQLVLDGGLGGDGHQDRVPIGRHGALTADLSDHLFSGDGQALGQGRYVTVSNLL